jgi:hypothetical protein
VVNLASADDGLDTAPVRAVVALASSREQGPTAHCTRDVRAWHVLLMYQELLHCARPEIAYALIPCRITCPAGKSAQPTKLAAKKPLLSAVGKPNNVFRL